MNKCSNDPVLYDALRELSVDHLLKHEMGENPVINFRTRYARIMQNINYQWKPKKFVYMIHEGFIYIVRVR